MGSTAPGMPMCARVDALGQGSGVLGVQMLWGPSVGLAGSGHLHCLSLCAV